MAVNYKEIQFEEHIEAHLPVSGPCKTLISKDVTGMIDSRGEA